jgi:hypothetical protein
VATNNLPVSTNPGPIRTPLWAGAPELDPRWQKWFLDQGNGASSSASLAPPITFATANASQGFYGTTGYYQFSGLVLIPSDITNLEEIDILMVDASGNGILVDRLFGPFTAGAVAGWGSPAYLLPSSGPNLVFTPVVVSLNAAGTPTLPALDLTTVTVTPGSTGSPNGIVVNVALTGSYNVIAPAPSGDGQTLLYIFRQDGSGHVVSWNTGGALVHFFPTVDFRPNLVTTVLFVAYGGEWWGVDIIGRHL